MQRSFRTNQGSKLALIATHVSRAYMKITQLSTQHLFSWTNFKKEDNLNQNTVFISDYGRLRSVTTNLQVTSMLYKNQTLMEKIKERRKQPKSQISQDSFSSHTYLSQLPTAALKVKSRNGETSLQIQSKELRLHRLLLASAIRRKTWAVQLLPSKAI